LIKTLIKKEIQIQKANIYFAICVVAIWLFTIPLTFLKNTPILVKILTAGKLAQIIHYFFVLPVLIVILPIMIGATSVASEKKLGVMGWQQSLPVSKRLQWVVKTGTAIFLCIFTNWVLVFLLNFLHVHFQKVYGIHYIFANDEFMEFFKIKGFWPGLFSLIFCSIGIWSSTVTRDPFRALIWGIVLSLLFIRTQRVLNPAFYLYPQSFFPHSDMLRIPLLHHLNMIIIIFLLVFMGFFNYTAGKSRFNKLLLQLVILSILIKLLYSFTLYKELNIKPLIDKKKTGIKGITKLIGYPNIFVRGAIRVPGSSKVTLSVTKAYNQGLIRRKRIITIDVKTKKIKFVGKNSYIRSIDPDGEYYTTFSAFFGDSITLKSGRSIPYWNKKFFELIMNKDFKIPQILIDNTRILNVKMIDQKGNLIKTSSTHNTFKISENFIETTIHKAGKGFGADLLFGNRQLRENDQKTTPSWTRSLAKKTEKPFIYQIIDKKDTACYQSVMISRDESWYSWKRFCAEKSWFTGKENRYDHYEKYNYLPEDRGNVIYLKKTDGSTSWTIECRGTYVILKNLIDTNDSTRHDNRINDLKPSIPKYQLPKTPDSRFLLFSRLYGTYLKINGKEYPDGFPERLELTLFDLNTGKEKILHTFRSGKRANKMRDEFTRNFTKTLNADKKKTLSNKLSILKKERPKAKTPEFLWLNNNKLVVLYYDELCIFQYDTVKKDFSLLNQIKMDILYKEKFPYVYSLLMYNKIAIWDNDILLVWNYNGLWKIELKKLKKCGDLS
jgi:hypothetical protein